MHLDISVCKDAADAIAQGYVYTNGDFMPLDIQKAVVVLNGTEEGNPTVDFVLFDQQGQKYATIITGKLLKLLSDVMFKSG